MSNIDDKRYTVAIRTLGLNPQMLRQELESVWRQTVSPERVVVYIARGYDIPDFRVGEETYVYTDKGMLRQRALDYNDIDTEYILFMDDDVLLAPDSAETLLDAIDGYDCVAPDVFANHKMGARAKAYAALCNLTCPHGGDKYAIKVHANGSFSYNGSPKPRLYESQSASGPCSLWRKASYLSIRPKDELWIETLGFPYCEDQLIFYKLHTNGGRLAVHYGCTPVNNNGQTSSGSYHRDPERLYRRAKAQYMVWHRTIYSWRRGLLPKAWAVAAIMLKTLWMIPVHIVAAIVMRDIKAPYQLIRGTIAGIRGTHSEPYQSLPPYKI